jgi:protein-S-isoprenylcysteine O-methyltransferase Ste14
MRKGFTFLLGLLVIVVVWFVIPVLMITSNILCGLPVITNIYAKALGFVVFILGFSAMIYTVYYHLVTGRVTPVAVEPPKKFIKEGFYKYSRNPMYIAILTTFFGGFLILGYVLLLVYALFAALALHLFVVYKEEPELKRKFGKEYEEYIKKVPRWFKIPQSKKYYLL